MIFNWAINHLIIYLIRGGQETGKMRLCGFINGDFLDDGIVSTSCNRSDADSVFPSPGDNVLQWDIEILHDSHLHAVCWR